MSEFCDMWELGFGHNLFSIFLSRSNQSKQSHDENQLKKSLKECSMAKVNIRNIRTMPNISF